MIKVKQILNIGDRVRINFDIFNRDYQCIADNLYEGVEMVAKAYEDVMEDMHEIKKVYESGEYDYLLSRIENRLEGEFNIDTYDSYIHNTLERVYLTIDRQNNVKPDVVEFKIADLLNINRKSVYMIPIDSTSARVVINMKDM